MVGPLDQANAASAADNHDVGHPEKQSVFDDAWLVFKRARQGSGILDAVGKGAVKDMVVIVGDKRFAVAFAKRDLATESFQPARMGLPRESGHFHRHRAPI